MRVGSSSRVTGAKGIPQPGHRAVSLSIRVEELARAIVCLDSTDLPSLVHVQDELSDLAASLQEPGLETLARVCLRAAEAVEGIVLRSVDDAETRLAEVRLAIEYAQQVADAALVGLDPADVPLPRRLAGTGPAPADNEIDLELLSAWVSSCSSALNDLEAAVVQIEAGEDEPGRQDEARRIIHTIKGEAGILSLGAIQAVCHECETLIDLNRERGRALPADQILALIDWTRACITRLSEQPDATLPPHEHLLQRIAAEVQASEPSSPCPAADPADGPVLFPPEAVIDDTSADFVCEAREHIAGAEHALLRLESDLENLELINTVFRAFHTIKGVAGFMHLTPIVRLTHVAETLLDRARSGTLRLSTGHLDLFLKACDILGQLIGAIQGGPPPMHSALEHMTRLLDQACTAGNASALPGPPDPDTAPVTRNPSPAEPPPAAGRQPTAGEPKPAPGAGPAIQKHAPRVEQTVKVNTTRMDALVDMVGELVIGYQMLYQDQTIQDLKQQHTQRTIGHVAKIVRDLQEVAMSLRLVTLRPTFQKMARLVRDVSAKAGKDIRFHTDGEDVELERNVVDEIADPLVHMIRNSCDHGIEPAEERRAAGKPPEGNLALRAYHQGGSIVVEIADDGRGLNRDRILDKAIAKGLYTPDRELAEIPDAVVYNLIFLPGFSTADTITDISGRGVGMDVVRRNIEALRGKVEIDSTPGEGSVFRMRLPLTMAIIDGMIVRVGSQRYVLPTLAIEQTFRPAPETIHTAAGSGEMAMVRGELLPLYRARDVLGLTEGAESLQESLLLVLESHQLRFCLLVDEIVGQQQVVIKNLGRGLAPIRGVSGGAILGDGRVALILDVRGIVARATSAA